MAGMTDLDEMLRQVTVRRRDGDYVYVVVPDLQSALELDPAALVQEDEGITAVIPRHVADGHDLDYGYVAAWLTLEIHSALEAVGLTAAFSRALGDAGISCNVVAGYHHDHILVPASHADAAIRTLQQLAASR